MRVLGRQAFKLLKGTMDMEAGPSRINDDSESSEDCEDEDEDEEYEDEDEEYEDEEYDEEENEEQDCEEQECEEQECEEQECEEQECEEQECEEQECEEQECEEQEYEEQEYEELQYEEQRYKELQYEEQRYKELQNEEQRYKELGYEEQEYEEFEYEEQEYEEQEYEEFEYEEQGYEEQVGSRQPEKTDLDEFLENYKVNPMCLLQILSYLDFDEWGNTRLDNGADEALEKQLTVKRIYPLEGFCVRALTLEECVVFINICHCDDIQRPSNALLDTLLNMSDDPPTVNLPLSLGKPHRERDDDGRICIAFDIILNSLFYEQQVNKYELLRAYILSLCITGINDKYHNTIQVDSCVKLGRSYHGTMPKQYIDRKMSSFEEDQELVRVYTQAKAARVVKWAKMNALKRLQKLHNYTKRKFRAPVRLSERQRSAACYECQPSTSRMRTRSCKSPEPSTSFSEAIFPPTQMDEIEALRGMEFLDMEGIVRIGIHVESDHLPHPTIIPPGPRNESIDLLYKLEYANVGYDLDYELFQLCGDYSSEYLAIVELPYDTILEEIAVFASRDGLVVCDKDARRYLELGVPLQILPKRIKITVNRLNMTLSLPIVPDETPCDPDDEDQEVPNMSD